MIKTVMTPQEVCHEYQMALSTVYGGIQSRTLPSLRIGRIYRIIPEGFFEQDLHSMFPMQLTSRDVCNILKISLPTLYKLVKEQAFPVKYYGRALRIPRSSFIVWLRLSSTRPESKAVIEADQFISNILSCIIGGIYCEE